MILRTNANPARQREHSVTQSFPAMLTILEAVTQYTSTSYNVSPDANSRES